MAQKNAWDTRGREWDQKLVNCCRPEKMGTKEFGNMVKRIQTLEEEESQSKRRRIGESREKRKELREKENNRLSNHFEMESLLAKKTPVEFVKGGKRIAK